MAHDFSMPQPKIEKKEKKIESFGDIAEIAPVLKNQEKNIRVLDHYDVYFKYLTILFVSYNSIKLNFKKSGKEQSNNR